MSVQGVTIYSPRGTIGTRLGFLVYTAPREFVEASFGSRSWAAFSPEQKEDVPFFMRGLERRSLLTGNFAIADS